MKYYLIIIGYNKVTDADEPIKPAVFEKYDDANKAFHASLYQNIDNGTNSEYLCMVVNQLGNVEKMERWIEEKPKKEENQTPTTPGETPVTPEEPSEGGEE